MSDLAIRVEFFGDEIDRITEFNPVTGTRQNVVKMCIRDRPNTENQTVDWSQCAKS